MKKKSSVKFLTFFIIGVLMSYTGSELKAQKDVLDLYSGVDIPNCIMDLIEIKKDIIQAANDPDTTVFFRNVYGLRSLIKTPPDNVYKFAAANDNTCPAITAGAGEFHILFKSNNVKTALKKFSFKIFTTLGLTPTVTYYQGVNHNENDGIGITGGRRYIFKNNTTAFDSIIITCIENSGYNDDNLFILDSLIINSSPFNISLSSNNVNENSPAGTVIGLFSASDPDKSDTYNYSLVSGAGDTDNGSFRINSKNLETDAVFNFESDASYSIRVQADDGYGGIYSREFVININDVIEVVNFNIDNLINSSLPENQSYSSPVPHFTLAPIGSVTYQISGTDADDFTLNGSTGVVSMVPGDFESPADADGNNTYSVTLTATDDDGNTKGVTWTITITDVKEIVNFNIEGIANIQIDENTVYDKTPSLSATPIGDVTWSLSGADAGVFSFDSSNGQITSNGKNFEEPQDNGLNNVYDLTLTATDEDDNSNSISWTVTIKNVQETANFQIQPVSSTTVGENTNYNSGSMSLTGDTPIGTVTYTLEAGSDDEFSIISANGTVTMSGQNYESPTDADQDRTYIVIIKAKDSDNNSNSITWTVTLQDVIEDSDFVIVDIPDQSIYENEEYYYDASVSTSPEPIGNVTYSLEGTDGSKFTVNQLTGEVRMVARDHEYPEDSNDDNRYEVTLRATDDDGNTDTEDWIVTVQDVSNVLENPPTVVCLFDLSGSMNMGFDDKPASTSEGVKLTLAKSALIAFIDLLHEFNPGKASFGFARFPNSPQTGCDAGSIREIRTLTEEFREELAGLIPTLSAPGWSTPILRGLDFAIEMFNTTNNKVMVLLSDGRHNCPDMNITSTITNDYANRLNQEEIVLYTIGFGLTSLVPNQMLSAISTATTVGVRTGAHYNIDAFFSKNEEEEFDFDDPGSWDPGTALHAAYANIIREGLGLESSDDPLDTINKGSVKRFEIPVTIFDEKVCFFVSWITPQQNYIGVKLLTPSGNELQLTQTGVTSIHRSNHTIITLSGELLDQTGMTGIWNLEVNGSGLNGPTEHYQHTVLTASKKVDLRTWFDKERYLTGDRIRIYLELLMDGKPLTGLDKTAITGMKPSMSPGNWLTSRKVNAAMLEKAKQNLAFSEKIDPAALRVHALMDEYKMPLPENVRIKGLRFSDNGTNGDSKAGDGIYTATLIPKTEGSYSFNISCSDSSYGETIIRESHIETYVGTRLVVRPSFRNIRVIGEFLKGEKTFELIFKLKDRYGNIPLPSAIGDVELIISKGKLVGGIIDNMDGTFTQRIVLPEKVKPGSVILTLSADNLSVSSRIATSIFKNGFLITGLVVAVAAGIFSSYKIYKRKTRKKQKEE